MPKRPTFPLCLDEVKKITIGWLRQMGHLKPHHWTRGSLNWSRAGRPSGNVTVTADTDDQYIELSYAVNGRDINYRINLESLPSNLGIGKVLYFICPATGRRCRTLYECGDYFYSRYAFYQPMYSSQTASKRFRGLGQAFGLISIREDFLRKPYSRTHYKGKITRRYQRILTRENRFNPDRIRLIMSAIRS